MPPKGSGMKSSSGSGLKSSSSSSLRRGESSKSSSSSSSTLPSSSSSSSSAPNRKLSSMLSFQPSLSFKPAPKPGFTASQTAAKNEDHKTVKKEELDRTLMPPPPASLFPKSKPKPSSFHQPSGSRRMNGNGNGISQSASKGKGKEREVIEVHSDDEEADERHHNVLLEDASSQMWTELYAPTSEAELAPGKARIQRVKNWLHESLYGHPFDVPPPPKGVNRDKIRKYKRILLLTGPAGGGKTTTIRLLARDLGVDVVEWGEGVEEWSLGGGIDRESSMSKFTSFISRHSFPSLSLSDPSSSPSVSSLISPATSKPRLILLTALPNLSHLATREAFHATLLNFCQSFTSSSCPMVIVHSDAGAGGRAEESWMDRERGGREGAIEVLGREVRDGPWCQEIDFLPLAPTFLNRALLRVLQTAIPKVVNRPSQSAVQLIALSSHGDLRSAINSLQVVCSGRSRDGSKKRKTRDDDDELEADTGSGKKKKGRGKGSQGGRGAKLDVSRDMRAVLDAVTRKEQSLNLFHALGKVFYNKRLGDPNMDDEDEEHLEVIRNLPLDDPLPTHLQESVRRKSLIQMESFVSSIPIDASSFALWIHQSFPNYCEDIEQVAAGLDELCAADIMRTDDDIWQAGTQAIAYSLHLTVRGVQMALPSPVPRRSQKVLKPQFFQSYRAGRENVSALDTIAGHIVKKGVLASNAFADGSSLSTGVNGLHLDRDLKSGHGIGVDLGVWGGVSSKQVVAGEMIPMMLKIQSASKRPLLPSSAQSLVLPPFTAHMRSRDIELTAKDEPDQSDFEERPSDLDLDLQDAEDDGHGKQHEDEKGENQVWDDAELASVDGDENRAGDGLEDDDITDWD